MPGWRGLMGVAICRGGYGVLLAFSMSAFTRWFVVHPVQAFAWLLRIFGRCACRYAHRLPRPCLRPRPRDASGCVRVGVYGCHGFACGRTPQRVLGGFAGIERRFRHGFRTSVRFSVGGLFAVGSADPGKRRRVVAFRADLACETAQKLRRPSPPSWWRRR